MLPLFATHDVVGARYSGTKKPENNTASERANKKSQQFRPPMHSNTQKYVLDQIHEITVSSPHSPGQKKKWNRPGVADVFKCVMARFLNRPFRIRIGFRRKVTCFLTRGHVDFHVDFCFWPFRKRLGRVLKGFATKSRDPTPRPERQHGLPNTQHGLPNSRDSCREISAPSLSRSPIRSSFVSNF